MSDIKLPPPPEPLPAMKWEHSMYTADQLRAEALFAAADAIIALKIEGETR